MAIGQVLQVMSPKPQLGNTMSFPMTPTADALMGSASTDVPTTLAPPMGAVPFLPGSEDISAIARSSGAASSGAPISGDTPEKLLLRQQVNYLEWKNQETKVEAETSAKRIFDQQREGFERAANEFEFMARDKAEAKLAETKARLESQFGSEINRTKNEANRAIIQRTMQWENHARQEVQQTKAEAEAAMEARQALLSSEAHAHVAHNRDTILNEARSSLQDHHTNFEEASQARVQHVELLLSQELEAMRLQFAEHESRSQFQEQQWSQNAGATEAYFRSEAERWQQISKDRDADFKREMDLLRFDLERAEADLLTQRNQQPMDTGNSDMEKLKAELHAASVDRQYQEFQHERENTQFHKMYQDMESENAKLQEMLTKFLSMSEETPRRETLPGVVHMPHKDAAAGAPLDSAMKPESVWQFLGKQAERKEPASPCASINASCHTPLCFCHLLLL